MGDSARRTFTLRDALVLVGATAVGFAGILYAWDETEWLWGQFVRPETGWTAGALMGRIPSALLLHLPLLVAWTLAILGLRLLPPRPSFHRVATQPGMAACGSVAILLALGSVDYFVRSALALSERVSVWPQFYHLVIAVAPGHAPHAIATAWGLLALGRRCRCEPSWIDRAGRAIGILWFTVSSCNWWFDIKDFMVSYEP